MTHDLLKNYNIFYVIEVEEGRRRHRGNQNDSITYVLPGHLLSEDSGSTSHRKQVLKFPNLKSFYPFLLYYLKIDV